MNVSRKYYSSEERLNILRDYYSSGKSLKAFLPTPLQMYELFLNDNGKLQEIWILAV